MARIDRPRQAFGEIDDAACTEARHQGAGFRVETKQPISAVHEDSQAAGGVAPCGNAPVDEASPIWRLAILERLRIEAPQLLARRRVECHDTVVGRAHVEHVLNHQRCVLKRAGLGAVLRKGPLRRFPRPCHGQGCDVGSVDVRERSVVGRTGIARVDGPLVRWCSLRGERHDEQREDSSHRFTSLCIPSVRCRPAGR